MQEADLFNVSDTDFSVELADFAARASEHSLPASVIHAAQRSIFDTLCCVAAGSSARAVGDVHGLAVEWGGRQQADILVYGEQVPAHHAAWVNGTMAHACNYGDTHDAAVLQASVVVVPAALAAAQLVGASGALLLVAVAVGLETVCRLGVATRVGIIESGYMYTSLFGGFGATLAVAKVMGLSREQTIDALGIVYSQVAGNHQVSRDAALVKRMQPGFAAMSAVLSGQLAQREISGSQGTFDGVDGFLRVYLQGQCDTDVLRAGLGKRYEMTALSCKPYPCSRFMHSAIDAALWMRAQGVDAQSIAAINVGMNRQAYEALRSQHAAWHSGVQAQFSLTLGVAAALIDGAVRLAHFTSQSLQRADLQGVAQKVTSYVDPDIERESSRNVSPVVMTLSLQNGEQISHRVDVPRGHPSRPMSMEDLEIKAQDCFAVASMPARAGSATRLRAMVEQLLALPNVEPLVSALRPEPNHLLFSMSG